MNICFETQTLDGLLGDLQLHHSDDRDANVLLVGGKAIDLDNYPKLQGIFKTGVGTDNLPFETAKERGIEIALPQSETCQIIFKETASFASHLILSCLLRNIGNFEYWKKHPRRALSSCEALVIGTGRIGKIVRDRMIPFCSVKTYDAQSNSPDQLEALIRAADCISIHLPLTSATTGFFNQEKLSWMKDGSALVNTARGLIVDESALYAELNSGRLFAALDVFSQEPYNGPLRDLPDDAVILTPHVASTCSEFLEETAKDFLAFVKKIEGKATDA